MTNHKDLPYLNHILDYINDIEESISGLNKSEFSSDKDVKESNIRRIEIIGEAVKNLSSEVKEEYKETEWSKIASMRDRIAHKYFDVDIDIIWDVIETYIPTLKKQIIKIKKDLEKSE